MDIVGIFCEDLREEKNGQVTLVGLMPDTAHLPARPENLESGKNYRALIPKIALYIRARIGIDEEVSSPMTVSLVFADKNVLRLGEITSDLIAQAKAQAKANSLPYAGVIFHAVFQGFQTPGPGLVIATVEADGFREVCAILNIKDAVTPTNASVPPSSQSASASPPTVPRP